MRPIPKCDVLIPIYNDFDSLVSLSKLISESNHPNFRFIIVNNGSTDDRIHDFLIHENLEFITVKENLGFGGAILFGAQNVTTNWVAWMPGNLKVRPNDVLNFLSDFDFKPNVFVKAKRINRKRVDYLKTLIAGLIQSIILRTNMLDTGGTPTVCERSFLISLKNPPKDFVFESFTLFVARRQKMKIIRPGVPYGQRLYGVSHWQRGLKSEINLMRKIIRSCFLWKQITNDAE
jgi:glycosyltransferase involved in cell wall biosynthesis